MIVTALCGMRGVSPLASSRKSRMIGVPGGGGNGCGELGSPQVLRSGQPGFLALVLALAPRLRSKRQANRVGFRMELSFLHLYVWSCFSRYAALRAAASKFLQLDNRKRLRRAVVRNVKTVRLWEEACGRRGGWTNLFVYPTTSLGASTLRFGIIRRVSESCFQGAPARVLQLPDYSEKRQGLKYVIRDVNLPPEETDSRRRRIMVMVVVPTFTKAEHPKDYVVAACIGGLVAH